MKYTLLLSLSLSSFATLAQLPGDLPWPAGTCDGNSIILHRGIAPATCGVFESMAPADRYTFGMMSLNGSLPGAGRIETTDMDSMYHHSTWTVDNIGNPFGIAINTRTAEVFLTASTNYGAGFFGNPSVLNHGSLGGADQVEAGGAVYKIDAVTGAVSLFANLPQQSTTFTVRDCETGTSLVRSNTSVGLGNIAYDPIFNQYFVTNIEDGRIYRLDAEGTILDSFDPFTYDDGVAGISILSEVPYGIVVEPGSNRVLFGVIDPQPGAFFADVGAPGIYSIDLTVTGAFVGTVDNTYLPVGATYDNYVGTETLHTTIPTGSGPTYTTGTTYLISDLEFDPNGNLLVGIRVSCYENFFGSYNHWAETNLVTIDPGTQLYNNSIFEYDISALGDAGPEDNYGGVSSYIRSDNRIAYVASSADILIETGPHGLAVWEDINFSTPVSPLGAFSYGAADSGDPKGIGGDVNVFTSCRIVPDLVTVPDTACINGDIDLSTLVSDANSVLGVLSYYPTLNDAKYLINSISNMVTVVSDTMFYVRKDDPDGYFDIDSISVLINKITAATVADQRVCNNDAIEAFTITLATVGDGTLTYQWQSSITDCSTGFSDIPGAISEIYESDAIIMTTYFRLITTSTLGTVACNDTSNCTTLTLDLFPETRCIRVDLMKK